MNADGNDCGFDIAFSIKAEYHANLWAEVHLGQWWWTGCLPQCLSIGLFGSTRFIWLVSFSSRCWWVFFRSLFGCVLVYVAAVALVCLHPSAVFMCMWVCWVCMCVGGILLVEAGSCLQSGSQQSPDLWPSHSRTTTNRLRLLFSVEKPLLHLSWLHLCSFLSPQYHCPHPVCQFSSFLAMHFSLDFSSTLHWPADV